MKLDEYDLISGKVKRLEYQKNQADQWLHQFEYDILNRLKKVGTSRDNWYYEQDANYWYYLHRPLMRTEIGHRQVQGLDYVYSINGWHKTLNNYACDSVLDAGQDGHLLNHQYVARDVLGYQINYFNKDYKSVGLYSVNTFSNFVSLYNGNIGASIITQDTMKPMMRKYEYDVLNRLRGVDWGIGNLGNFFSVSSFRERLSYDRDGNIVRLDRWAKGGVMDSLVYRYYSGNNRLKQVEDMVAASVYNNDVDNQTDTMNYIYDKAGNLVEDKSEQLKMRWTYYGKLKEVDSGGVVKLRFYYDAMGNRVVKENVMNGTKEVYVRDAQGNVIVVYEIKKKNNIDSLFTKEFHIFGSNRLGYLMDRKFLSRKTYGKTFGGALPALPLNPIISIPNPFLLPGSTTITPIYFGNKRYEISDWLGNVRVVINDKKTPVNTGTTTMSYWPQVMSVSDYYSFGSSINERTYSVVKYKYGFNDKENLDEVYGSGNFQDYGARMYATRLGRFISADPIIINQHKYTFYSPYQFAGNKPIVAIDLDGLEEMWMHTSYVNGQKQEMRIFSTDENYAVQKQYLAQQLGIDVSKFGMQGVLVTEEKEGKLSMMYNSMPAVEVSYHKWQGLANEMGNFLSDSKLDKLNSAFVQRYYGSEGQERFVNDLQEQSTYVKAAGVVTGVAGVLTGNPILVEAGIGLYNVGDRMENIGEGIMAVRELGNNSEFTKRVSKMVVGEAYETSIMRQNVPLANKFISKFIGNHLIDKIFNNININKTNNDNTNSNSDSNSKPRIE